MIGIAIGNFIGKGSSGSSWTPQYRTLLNTMAVKPSGVDQIYQRKLMYDLVHGDLINDIELLYILSSDTDDNGRYNWKNPSLYKLTNNANPVFEAYKGFKGVIATESLLKTGFIPSANGTVIGLNDITLIIGVGDNSFNGGGDVGCQSLDASSNLRIRTRDTIEGFVNSATLSQYATAYTSTINPFAIGRNAVDKQYLMVGYNYAEFVIDSLALPNQAMPICGVRTWHYAASDKTIRYCVLAKGLTRLKVTKLINIMEKYLVNYTTNLMNQLIVPSVTFTFDDNSIGHYTKVFPMFVSKGITGTFWVIGNTVTDNGVNMTWTKLIEMYNAGNNIEDHSYDHADFTTLNEAQIRAEFTTQDALFVAKGLPVPKYFAYPFGARNALVNAVTSEYRLMSRGVGVELSPKGHFSYHIYKDNSKVSVPTIDLSDLSALTIQGYKDQMTILKETSVAYTYMIHGVDDTYLGFLEQLVDHAQSIGLGIINFDQLYNRMI